MGKRITLQDVTIAGSGSFLPGDPVPPGRIEEYLGKITRAPQAVMRWIERNAPVFRQILGMEKYYYAIDPETGKFTEDNVTMSVKAACKALEAARMEAREIEFIAYASPHMDQMPTASVRIQEALGIERCAEMSIHANCSSAYKALLVAHNLLRSGVYRTALVVSSNIASSELRADYYNQPLIEKEALFLRWFLCDGAGALVLSVADGAKGRLVLEHTHIESVGGRRGIKMFNRRPALWMNPKEEFEKGLHHLYQAFRNQLAGPDFRDGDKSVFAAGFERMLEAGGINPAKIRFFQLNLPAKHIAESVREECAALGVSPGAFYSGLEDMGYCGPPMAFLGLDRIMREERLKKGDIIASFALEVSKFMLGGYAAVCR